MKLKCFWEHNGDDSLLFSTEYLSAYAKGESLEIAKQKMPSEISSFTLWSGQEKPQITQIDVTEEKTSDLNICDADSDAIFLCETAPMSLDEYLYLKALSLKSAKDFLTLYNLISDKNASCLPSRQTFYGAVPRTAKEMYEHTKNVNAYNFGEIGTDCDNDGNIVSCREHGFALLEQKPEFLNNKPIVGSYGETWSLKKVLRRFIWHDRIHAKAMYRTAVKIFGEDSVPDIFHFKNL